jgi:hypothetical protein
VSSPGSRTITAVRRCGGLCVLKSPAHPFHPATSAHVCVSRRLFNRTCSSPEPALLAAALFLWQFPHFFALSWVHRKDYSRGGFQMIPCNDPAGVRTAELIMRSVDFVQPQGPWHTELSQWWQVLSVPGAFANHGGCVRCHGEHVRGGRHCS